MFYRAPAVLRHDGVAARVLRFSLGYDQRGAPVGAFCPHLRAIHDLHRQRGRLTQRETKRKSHKESTFKKRNTCSLCLIQHDATGGRPAKKHVTRALCPTVTSKCCGGFLKCKASPAKQNKHTLSGLTLVTVLRPKNSRVEGNHPLCKCEIKDRSSSVGLRTVCGQLGLYSLPRRPL